MLFLLSFYSLVLFKFPFEFNNGWLPEPGILVITLETVNQCVVIESLGLFPECYKKYNKHDCIAYNLNVFAD